MSTTPTQDSASGNPYIAPRSKATVGGSRAMTFAIIGIIALGFASAGAFAYWRVSTPELEEDNVQQQMRAYEKPARAMRPMHRITN